MDQGDLCKRCKLLTLDSLEDGHLLYPHVADLRDEAECEGACTICSLIWWSLRYDHLSILRDETAPVRLFLNPPPSKSTEKLHRLDIIVTRKDTSEFLWLPCSSGEPWRLGPPDSRNDIFRGHLTLYSSHGGYIAIPYVLARPLIKLRRSTREAFQISAP